mgnify:CR=1 FL=1
MNLENIPTIKGATHPTKRLGRGEGSGHGKTSGKGHKGQKARSGGGIRIGFEGGQMPLQMRLPKFGFSSRVNNFSKDLNIKNINGIELINLNTLKEHKLISKSVKKVKIFGNTEINSKLTVEGIQVTKGARKSIESAGGKIIDPESVNKSDLTNGDNS